MFHEEYANLMQQIENIMRQSTHFKSITGEIANFTGKLQVFC